ncbi:MAG: phosphoribosylamine--glycine ligase, partial [bacterium]|nr:phosphoribosylamine--glycine ligase [bacterium]
AVHATGGRVLSVTSIGPDVGTAADLAYRGVAAIHFEGAQHRADIGPARTGAHP